jgi:tryptophan halogenase
MKICIIGGGTTGWWCAAYMERNLPDADITLIESNTIPIVGVGESTLPMIKTFFDDMGLDEADWMPEANAIHKIGNIKQGWTQPFDDEFPFTFWYNDNNVFDTWIQKYLAADCDKTDINPDLYEHGGWKSVAYHLDAEQAGQVLRRRCTRVNHVIDTLDGLPDGYDLYIDCTGFARRFVKDKSTTEFPHHLVNSAWVCPYQLDKHEPYTRSIARSSGWQFIIGLTNRIGTGYVFSDKYISDNDALQDFKNFNRHRKPFEDKQPRLLKWKPEVLTNPWTDNVVAIGLANGFLDPLESNALFMTQFQITQLVECIKRGYSNKTYNKANRLMWLQNHEYIYHHYALSDRTDSNFWLYYSGHDVRKSLWENYKARGNKYTQLFPDSIWATLGLYYDEFTYYEKK